MFDDFQKALESASNIKDTGEFADIDKLFESAFQEPAVDAARAGTVGRAQVANANADQAIQDRVDELKEKLELERAKTNPSNYKQIVNVKDGGFDFYDPEGNPISAIEYARITGKSVLDLLKDSARQADIDFREDYGTMLALNNAVASGDVETFFKENEQLKPIKRELLKMTNDELMDLLFQQHPEAFQLGVELDSPRITGEAGENILQKTLDRLLPGSQFGNQQEFEFPGFTSGVTKVGNRF